MMEIINGSFIIIHMILHLREAVKVEKNVLIIIL